MENITKQDLNDDWQLEAGYKEQEQFLSEWPVERIKTMTLDEYDLTYK